MHSINNTRKALGRVIKIIALIVLIVLVFSPLQPLLKVSIVHAEPQIPGNPATYYSAEQVLAITQNQQSVGDDIGCTEVKDANGNDVKGGMLFAICMSGLVYYVAALMSNIAYICAYFFSFVAAASINGLTYTLNFISIGWTWMRDISNMAFIFILMYLGYTIMLKAETTGTMQMLARVIVIALVVNFSFFFTRVVIDAGNIVATQIYNSIEVESASGVPQTIGSNKTKDLTAGIMGAVQIQTIYGSTNFQNFVGSAGPMATFVTLSLVYLATAVMYLLLILAFLSAGITFLFRIVGLWGVIIAAPIAFVLNTLKGTRWVFQKWLGFLVEFSFYPALFLFTFLILSQLVNEFSQDNLVGSIFGALNPENTTGQVGNIGIAEAIAEVVLRMGFVIAVLFLGLRAADWVSKGSGGMAMMLSSRAGDMMRDTVMAPFRLGAAGVQSAGRNTLGRGMYNLSRNLNLETRAQQGGARGAAWNALWQGTRKLSDSAYNIRHAPGGSVLRGVTQEFLGGKVNVGRGTRGGYVPPQNDGAPPAMRPPITPSTPPTTPGPRTPVPPRPPSRIPGTTSLANASTPTRPRPTPSTPSVVRLTPATPTTPPGPTRPPGTTAAAGSRTTPPPPPPHTPPPPVNYGVGAGSRENVGSMWHTVAEAAKREEDLEDLKKALKREGERTREELDKKLGEASRREAEGRTSIQQSLNTAAKSIGRNIELPKQGDRTYGDTPNSTPPSTSTPSTPPPSDTPKDEKSS